MRTYRGPVCIHLCPVSSFKAFFSLVLVSDAVSNNSPERWKLPSQRLTLHQVQPLVAANSCSIMLFATRNIDADVHLPERVLRPYLPRV